MEQIDVFKAKIVRPHANVAWGFRLEGGAEHGLPLKVHRVSAALYISTGLWVIHTVDSVKRKGI